MEARGRDGEDDDRQPPPRTQAMALRMPTHDSGPLDGISRRLLGGGSSGSTRSRRKARSMKDNDALVRLAATIVFLVASGTIITAVAVWLWRGSPPQPAGFINGIVGVTGV